MTCLQSGPATGSVTRARQRVRDDVYAVVTKILAETASPPSPTLPPSRGKGEEALVPNIENLDLEGNVG